MRMRRALGWVQMTLGRSRTAAHAAVMLRNQCHCVIRAHLAEGPDATKNGEANFLRTIIGARGQRPFVFFDVGANVGDWTALVEKLAPDARGVLFDPSALACETLRQRFHGTDVEIVPKAVGDAPSEGVFFQEPDAGTHSSLISTYARPGSERRVVSVTTVDIEARNRGIDHVDFLKIDCEGYDLHVLRGATGLLSRQQVTAVQFEYNAPWAQAGSTLAAALQLLRSMKYEVFLLKSAGLFRFRYERYGEFFDYSNFVALPEGTGSEFLVGTI